MIAVFSILLFAVASVSTALVCFLSGVFPLFTFAFIDTLLVGTFDATTSAREGREGVAILTSLVRFPRVLCSDDVEDLVDADAIEDQPGRGDSNEFLVNFFIHKALDSKVVFKVCFVCDADTAEGRESTLRE